MLKGLLTALFVRLDNLSMLTIILNQNLKISSRADNTDTSVRIINLDKSMNVFHMTSFNF